MAVGLGELGFVAVLIQFAITPDGKFDLMFTPVGPFKTYEECMAFKKEKDKELNINEKGYGFVKFKDGLVIFMKSSCRLNRFANDEKDG